SEGSKDGRPGSTPEGSTDGSYPEREARPAADSHPAGGSRMASPPPGAARTPGAGEARPSLVEPADRVMSRRGYGRTARRVTAAIVVTASLPFLAAVLVGKLTIDRLGAMATQPELGVAMERALGVYAD